MAVHVLMQVGPAEISISLVKIREPQVSEDMELRS
jgi:hypothetical protein